MSMLVPPSDLTLKEVGDASIDVVFFFVVVDTDMSILVPLYDLTRRGVAGLPVEAFQILDHCQHVHIWCKKAKKQ